MSIYDNRKKPSRWLWEWERQAHPIIIYQLARTYTFDKAWPYLLMPVLFVSKGQTVNLYFSCKVSRLANLLVRKIESGQFLPMYKKLMAKEKRQLSVYCNKLKATYFNKLTDSQLAHLVKEYSSLYRQHGVTPIRTLNQVGSSIIENLLKKKVITGNIAEMLSVLYWPPRASLEQESERYLHRLSKKLKSGTLGDNEINNKISAYLKRYAFIPCGYADEKSYTVGDVKIKLREMRQNHDIEHVIRTQRKQLIDKLNLPRGLVNLIDTLADFTFYKDFIRMNYNRLHYSTQPLFQEIANRLNVSREDLRYLTALEIKDALERDKLNRADIKARKKFYVCVTDGKTIHIKVGRDAKILFRQTENRVSQDLEIKGVGASLGKVQGVVRVVRSGKDLKNWPSKAVMVTPMTTPELVALAKKSIAVVTDEGGITCHAAIVSRELKIPCVIGTKTATKILKDGDLVEVDANNGIIRRL